MRLPTERYQDQVARWPAAGRHILAHHDDDTIVVYQAYRPEIGLYAAEHGRSGGAFGYGRMSWVKPNFLWMMYRSDWGRAQGQEVVLAVRLRSPFFDALLEEAVPSTFDPARHANEGAWQKDVARSAVRLQWDPDHTPSGARCERRAIQLGLRKAALEAYGQRECIEILDISAFVAEQRERVAHGARDLVTPVERVYTPADPEVSARLGLSPP